MITQLLGGKTRANQGIHIAANTLVCVAFEDLLDGRAWEFPPMCLRHHLWLWEERREDLMVSEPANDG